MSMDLVTDQKEICRTVFVSFGGIVHQNLTHLPLWSHGISFAEIRFSKNDHEKKAEIFKKIYTTAL